MKTKKFCINHTILLFFLLFISSCKHTNVDKSGMGMPIDVQVKLIGTDFEEQASPLLDASLPQTKSNRTVQSLQQHAELVSPGEVIITELHSAQKNTDSDGSSTLGKLAKVNKQATLPGTNITAGGKFRVIVYKSSNGEYVTHQDYEVGTPPQPIKMNVGELYTIIAYAYVANSSPSSSGNLPAINNSEKNNLDNATIPYDNNNRDFVYQKIENFSPSNGQNILNLILRHKLSQVAMRVEYNMPGELLGTVTVGNQSLTTGTISHYTSGIYNLKTGKMTGRNNLTNHSVTLKLGGSMPDKFYQSDPKFYLINLDGQGSFSVNIRFKELNGNIVTKTITATNAFLIKPEWTHHLVFKQTKCGAYIAPGVWKEFMCHNLGADYGRNPFTPSKEIHGAKYQWGKKDPVLSQAQDQSHAGSVSGWSTNPPPDGSWAASKTAKDPCPNGYRVPTEGEWRGVIQNNTFKRINTFEYGNYQSAVIIGSSLLLPTVGKRNVGDGALVDRGMFGYYWTSSYRPVNPALYFQINSNTQEIYENSRAYAYAVRCIKE